MAWSSNSDLPCDNTLGLCATTPPPKCISGEQDLCELWYMLIAMSAELGSTQKYQPGGTIYHSSCFIIICTGIVKQYAASRNVTNGVLVGFKQCGDFFYNKGNDANGHFRYEARDDVTVLKLNKDQVDTLLKSNPAYYSILFHCIQSSYSKLSTQLLKAKQCHTEAAINAIKVLANLPGVEMTEKGMEFKTRIYEICEITGISRRNGSRIIAKLEKEGMLNIDRRNGRFLIPHTSSLYENIIGTSEPIQAV
ncbi:MAG: Crp/Fnr family transcriptional regulator [Pseudomonadales bacterium]